MLFMSDFKAPPTLNNEISYSQWKKELSICQAFTNISKSKQAPAIFLSLTGQARDAITDLSLSILTSDAGVDNLLAKLDQLFLKDETLLLYEAFETFEKFIRPSEISIIDYIN